MLDVAEAFTAMDTSHANFVSQHHSSGLSPAIRCLNCLPKVAVALSKVLSNARFVTSIFTGGMDKLRVRVRVRVDSSSSCFHDFRCAL